MGIAVIFILGIANFALHSAVLNSGHSIVRTMQGGGGPVTSRFTLGLEFALLLAAMFLVANGYPGWGWTYGIYTAINAFTAWLILSGRI